MHVFIGQRRYLLVGRPNFFIIGAPKCGTTSVASWLADHHQVYFCPRKEPHFFDADHRLPSGVRDSLSRYEAYFAGATASHRAIGEASTHYLRSKVAVPAILQYSCGAKFIVCLREPVSMALSWHRQLLFEAMENEPSFEKAWELQMARRKGSAVPPLCHEPSHLFYLDVCSVGQQVKRLFERVERARVLVILLDDLRRDPRTVYQTMQSFLGVDNNGRQHFVALNQSRRVPRWVSVLNRHIVDTKRRLGVRAGLGLMRRVVVASSKVPADTISNEFRAHLRDSFREDVLELQEQVGRNLSEWIRPAPQ